VRPVDGLLLLPVDES
jgi:hypothetical protein